MKSWKEFLERQKKILGRETYEKWLSGIEVLSFDARNLYLQAKDLFQETWFKEQILPTLRLVNENGHPIKVHIGNKNKKKTESPKTNLLTFESSKISERSDFSHLFQYKENQEAFRLLTAISNRQSTVKIEPAQFNPIVLCGGVGTGKTSLLMATAIAFKKKGVSLLYVEAKKFAEHVVGAIRQFQMKEFRNVYRNVDLLIVDGIDIFASKNATQEEFFHTFNTLHLQKKQIIVSCSKPPKDLELEPRIISRLEWGLILPIKKPSKESVHLYLRWKEGQTGIAICEKSKQIINDRSHGSLKKIDLFFDLLAWKSEKKRVEFPELSELIDKCFSQEITPQFLIDKTAEYFQISSKEIYGKSQKKESSFPRQIAMFFCRKQLQMPYKQIGKLFSRDHSTVMSAVSLIEGQVSNSQKDVLDVLTNIQTKIDGAVS